MSPALQAALYVDEDHPGFRAGLSIFQENSEDKFGFVPNRVLSKLLTFGSATHVNELPTFHPY